MFSDRLLSLSRSAVVKYADSVNEDFEKAKAEFIQAAQNSPLRAITWKGREVMRAECMRAFAESLRRAAQREETTDEEWPSILKEILEDWVQTYLVRGRFLANSTCPLNNEAEAVEAATVGTIIERLGRYSYQAAAEERLVKKIAEAGGEEAFSALENRRTRRSHFLRDANGGDMLKACKLLGVKVKKAVKPEIVEALKAWIGDDEERLVQAMTETEAFEKKRRG
jgi:hypothetical protein